MDRVISPRQDDYPERLHALSDVAKALYWRGALDDAELAIAIVGSRAASGLALERAAHAAAAVAHAGGTVYSGGAIGVDAAAHRGAIAARGRTVAVLASGFDHYYPARHKPLYADILASGGALVTSYAPSIPPRRFQFVHRNRLLASMCDAVLVVEADVSSGSLYTARAAIAAGRRLLVMPGSPGCERLIAQGALVVENPEETATIARSGSDWVNPALASLGERERRILALLNDVPRSAEELAGACELEPRDVDRALTVLELSRLALAMPGRAFVRSTLGEAVDR